MIRAATTFPDTWSMADLLEHLGGIDPRRVRMVPAPGEATERDVVRIEQRENRLYELIDRVLVEKVMGLRESVVAGRLIGFLGPFVDDNDLGFVAAPDGMMRILSGLVRIPDVSFVSWEQVPEHEIPDKPIPDLYPDLAVEVLSEGNTPGEMKRKLKEYFLAGTRLVWYVDPDSRTVDVYTAPDESRRLNESQTLDGGDMLPGFSLPVKRLFARVKRVPAARKATKRKRKQ